MSFVAPAAPFVPGKAGTRRVPARARVGHGATLWMAVVMTFGSFGFLLLAEVAVEEAFVVACGACAASVVLALTAAYRQTDDPLNPMTLGMIYFGLLFPFHGFMMVDDLLVTSFLGIERWYHFGVASLVAGWAALALHLGFRSRMAGGIARRLPDLPFRVTDASIRRLFPVATLIAVSLVSKSVLYISGLGFHVGQRAENVADFMGVQFIAAIGSGLGAFAALLMLARAVRERRVSLWVVAGALVVVEIAWGLLSGSRQAALQPVVVGVVLLHRMVWSLRMWHVVAGLGLFVFIVFPFLTAFKENVTERRAAMPYDADQQTGVIESVTALFDEDDDSLASERDTALETLAARTHGLTSLALVIRYTPERHPYMLGVPYLMIPVQILVPRAIWPDKPAASAFADEFRTKYWGLRPDSPTSVAVSQLGDLWANLHLFGALVGSFLMGVLFRYLHQYLHLGSAPDSGFRHVIVSLLLLPAVFGLSAVGDAFLSGNIKTLAVFMLVAWMFRSRTVRGAA